MINCDGGGGPLREEEEEERRFSVIVEIEGQEEGDERKEEALSIIQSMVMGIDIVA